MVGGLEKVYEIGRNFRNEGVDATHNPEFTMLEAYEAYGDCSSIGALTRNLITSAAQAGLGSTIVRRPDGSEHDIGGEWPSVSVHDAVSAALGEKITPDTGEDQLRWLARQAGGAVEPSWNPGQGLLALLQHRVRARTGLPTLLRRFPGEGAPPAPA